MSREAEILLAIDEFAAELARFRAELVALLPPAMNGASADGANDFAEHCLIDLASAFVTGSIQNSSGSGGVDAQVMPMV